MRLRKQGINKLVDLVASLVLQLNSHSQKIVYMVYMGNNTHYYVVVHYEFM